MLAVILVFIGFKLCRPKVWLKVAEIGKEQFFIFAVTVLVTVTTDLLIGIGAGIALELVMSTWYVGLWHALREDSLGIRHDRVFSARLMSLFRNPVAQREFSDGDVPHLHRRASGLFQHVPPDPGAEAPAGRRQDGEAPSEPSRCPSSTTRPATSLHHFLDEFNGQDRDAEAGDRGTGT